MIQKFNTRAICIGIIPRNAQYAKGEDYEIRLNKNVEELEDMTNINITNIIMVSMVYDTFIDDVSDNILANVVKPL